MSCSISKLGNGKIATWQLSVAQRCIIMVLLVKKTIQQQQQMILLLPILVVVMVSLMVLQ